MAKQTTAKDKAAAQEAPTVTEQPSLSTDKELLILKKENINSIKIHTLNDRFAVVRMDVERHMYGCKLIDHSMAKQIQEKLMDESHKYVVIESYLWIEQDAITDKNIEEYSLTVDIKGQEDEEAH
ncbi:hypothetical protein K5X82_07315 [Halosquirtibacter xylanolyticus]|uniref:hypothetical protein n=1 Tax=Halosquirtibacter xylanolyticus TaxID=3374599 RepID=UPI00374A6416|nr:hypothetical protein K5X82_07315 [Prolixibacteraceae bacterium]